MRRNLAVALLAVLTACGSEVRPPYMGAGSVVYNPNAPDSEPWTPVAPTILAVSPGMMSVGDEITILGENFIPAGKGDVLLAISGTFFDDEGNTFPVDKQVRAKRQSPSKLTWRLYPDVVFHPQGNRLGSFVGEVKVINSSRDGTQLPSIGHAVSIDVQPSLIPRVVRPSRSADCEAVVRATLEDTRMTFSVEAVGLRPGTVDAPLIFQWTFLPTQWRVRFNYDSFEPEKVLPQGGALVLEDRVTDGLVSTMKDEGEKGVAAQAASDVYNNLSPFGEKRLSDLSTQPLPAEGNNRPSSVHVVVMDATGKTINLTIPVMVHRPADMIYEGASKLAERMQPTRVSDCIPGGDIGRHVTYREDKAETRARSVSFQYNGSAAMSSGLPSNPFALGINVSAGFGVDINASISTQQNKGLDITGQILPGEYGVFFRQTTKVYRVGKVVGYNVCGQTMDLGEVILTDWLFTPELATGMQCEPPSRLPPAQKFM